LRKICSAIVLIWIALSLAACSGFIKGDNRHNVPLSSAMHAALKSIGSSPGQAMMVRIFKQEQQLEVWKRTNSGQFRLLKTYEICAFSGELGPKFKEGDRQAPEGFYTITPGLMNPKSNYYLAFNTGFPNKYDRAHGRTGSNLMVHGDCSSSGCYAMTDEGIAEIYALARETFKGGNHSFQLQIFPFRMTPRNIAAHVDSEHLAFWRDIKEGYDYFELTRTPPTWDVCSGQYVFNAGGGGILDAAGPCPAQTRPRALVAKMEADEAKVADILAGVAEQENEQAAIAARGDAINSAVSGFFGNIGNIFGDDAAAVPASSGQPAPVPAVRPN
jgi:murein L,D-transpeptidase YafK